MKKRTLSRRATWMSQSSMVALAVIVGVAGGVTTQWSAALWWGTETETTDQEETTDDGGSAWTTFIHNLFGGSQSSVSSGDEPVYQENAATEPTAEPDSYFPGNTYEAAPVVSYPEYDDYQTGQDSTEPSVIIQPDPAVVESYDSEYQQQVNFYGEPTVLEEDPVVTPMDKPALVIENPYQKFAPPPTQEPITPTVEDLCASGIDLSWVVCPGQAPVFYIDPTQDPEANSGIVPAGTAWENGVPPWMQWTSHPSADGFVNTWTGTEGEDSSENFSGGEEWMNDEYGDGMADDEEDVDDVHAAAGDEKPNCGDDIDNNRNGPKDANDSDCGATGQGELLPSCKNGVNDDGDMETDFTGGDADCIGDGVGEILNCENWEDDDGDTLNDKADPDCRFGGRGEVQMMSR